VTGLILAALLATKVAAAKPAPRAPRPAPYTVTLNVKDADVREILGSMQKQCGIRNLIIDPQVQGIAGTFVFHALPCRTAFDTVFRTFGLKAISYDSSVVAVSPR
jgi:type II secretory pathway component GspD/PulD (secretin)